MIDALNHKIIFLFEYISSLIFEFGYLGIFIAMTIESSFIPFPSEIIMIPAGYLAYNQELNLILVIISGTLGSLVGALINYYLARNIGISMLQKYGKYIFIQPHSLEKSRKFFLKHGSTSTFFGRLLPMIRQYISIPAGLSKMNITKFMLFTSLGAGLWCITLTMLGYFFGNNQMIIKEYLHIIIISLICVVVIYILYKLYFNRYNKEK